MTKKVRYMYEAVLTVCLSMPIGCVQESGTEYPGSETDGAATAVVTLQVMCRPGLTGVTVRPSPGNS